MMRKIIAAVMAVMLLSLSAVGVSAENVDKTADTNTSASASVLQLRGIRPPSADFQRRAYKAYGKEIDGIIFCITTDNMYRALDPNDFFEEMEKQELIDEINTILSIEFYNEYMVYYSEFLDDGSGNAPTYEEYQAMVYENLKDYLGDDYDKYFGRGAQTAQPMAYFMVAVDNYGEKYSYEEIIIRATDRLFERINGDPEILRNVRCCFDSGKNYYAAAYAEYGEYVGNNSFWLETAFSDDINADYESDEVNYLEELVSMD